jgi:hypothetical protein
MKKILLLLTLLFAVFTIQTKAQTTVTIGTNTSTVNQFPLYYNFDYTYSQTIYTAAEIVGGGAPTPGIINKIRYYPGTTVATTNWKDWVIYLGNTTKEGFSGTADFIPPASMTQVFNGVIDASTTANTWFEITLTTPFYWDGASNLVVAIDQNTDAFGGSPTWKGYTLVPSSGSKGIYFYQDNTDILPASPSASTSNAVNLVAHIQFDMSSVPACSGTPTAGTTTSSTTNACSNSSFQLGLSGSTEASGLTYQWQSGPSVSGPWTDLTGATNIGLDTFQTTTTWYRCKVACGVDEAFSTPIEVTTPALVSGTFTINDALPTSGSNFNNFNDAVNYMACGVNGPIVFNVDPSSGPYNERFVINDIYGTTDINTITFNGNGRTIQFNSTTSATRTGIHLNGADYVTINNLTIDGSAGTYAWGIALTNEADNNTIANCTINVGTTGTSTNFLGIAINGSATATSSSGNNGNENIITDNTIIGGYYGVYLYGSSSLSTVNINNSVGFNNIQDAYYTGVYAIYQSDGLQIYKNEITRPTRTTFTTGYGIYLLSGTKGAVIRQNRIHNMFDGAPTATNTVYAIYISADGTAADPNYIINNAVYTLGGNGTLYGIYNTGAAYMKAYHNTISLDNAAATAGITYGFYQVTSDVGIEFKNNIVHITRGGSGAKYCIYKSTAATPLVSNYNVLFVGGAGAGAKNIGYVTSARVTLADWQTASSQDANSISVDPLFNDPSMGDYLFTESTIDDIGEALGITDDIVDSTRSLTTPDPGAWEAPPVAGIDVKPEALVSPATSANGCYNTETITVRVRNNGTTDINLTTNPLTVTVNVTGAAVASYSATVNSGTLLATAYIDVTMTTPSATLDMSTTGTYNFEMITSMSGDINAANDNFSESRSKQTLSAGTAIASPNSYCVTGGTPTLTLSGNTGNSNVQWQESTTSMSGFTDIVGGTTSPYTVGSAITQTMYYQAIVSCGVSTATSTEDTVALNNPSLSSTTPGSRCGTGTVDLNATSSSTVKWYANPSGGTALYTGNTFTTPIISSTTTYYAAASDVGSGADYSKPTYEVGSSATNLSTYGEVFTITEQILFNSVQVHSTTGTSLNIKLYNSDGTVELNATGAVPVTAGTSPIISLGWIIPPGTYRLAATGMVGNFYRDNTNTTYPIALGSFGQINGFHATITGSVNVGTSYYFLYRWNISTYCESARTGVTATINTPPTITASVLSDTICTGSSTDLSVTSGNAGYTYTWDPGSHVGATYNVSPTSTTKYYVNAEDNSGGPNDGCANIDSITITVLDPKLVGVTPVYASNCNNAGVKLDVIDSLYVGTETNMTAPTSGTSTLGPNILQYYYEGNKLQTIIRKSELNNLGAVANGTIKKLSFYLNAASDVNFANIIIKIGHTTDADYAALNNWKTGLTTVYTAATYTIPSAGWQEFVLTTPFTWNGVDNLVVEFIHSTDAYNLSTTNSANYSTTSFTSTLFYRADNVSAPAFEAYNGNATYSYSARQNMKITFDGGSSLNPVWSPLAGLFTDMALTTPYTGTPASTVYAAPSTTTTYSIVGNNGYCNTNTLNKEVLISALGEWNGSESTNWSIANNWCGGVPTASSAIVIPTSAISMPVILSGTQDGASINFKEGTSLTMNSGATLNVTNVLADGSATLTGTKSLIASNSFAFGNVNNKTFASNGALVLKSTTSGTARIADITNAGVNSGNEITGDITQERFIPAKASRKWIFLSSPLSQTIADSWQQQIHITGAGTGGTNCPTLTSHTNGFDATLTNVPNMYSYNAANIAGSRWTAATSTNATNVGMGVGYRVNVRGDRSIGCSLLDGTPAGLIPGEVTLRSTGSLSAANKNVGSFSITYPNVGINNYVFMGNPYPSAITFSGLQGANGTSINTNYAIYIAANAPGTYSYWSDDDGEFTGGVGYDNATGNILANGQAFFVQSLVAGDVTLNFSEAQKTTETNTGYFRTARVFNEKLKVNYLKDNQKVDEVVIRYANDASVSNTAIGKMDIPSMNSGTYITSLKDNKGMVVQTRELQNLTTDEVWLNIGATESGNYQLNFSNYENFAGASIILKDHYTQTEQDVKLNATYSFSIDKDNAATKGNARFSIVFNRTIEPVYVNNMIKMYPNPANKQVTLQLPQSADNSIVYQIKVTDLVGKVIMQQKANGGTTQFNIDRLTTGTYFVEIIDSKGNRTTEKLIKN